MQLDPAVMPQQSVYKLLIGCVVPRPIAWVSTVSVEGVHNLAPFSFFMAVCNDPPTIAFSSSRREGNKKDTVTNIEHTGDFVVNVVDDPLAEHIESDLWGVSTRGGRVCLDGSHVGAGRQGTGATPRRGPDQPRVPRRSHDLSRPR